MIAVPGAFDRGVATPAERAALFGCLVVVLEGMRAAGMLGAAVRITDAPPPPFGLGSKGPLVRVWQMVLGPLYKGKPDDDFGPLMLAAHRDWAGKLGFGKADVVTPAMWATGVGVTLILTDEGVTLADGSKISVEEASRAAHELAPGAPA